jgi:hypothetical protein
MNTDCSLYFESKVQPLGNCPNSYADLSILFAVEHVVLNVILSIQVVRGLKWENCEEFGTSPKRKFYL